MSSQAIVGNLAVDVGITDDKLQAGLAQIVNQVQEAGNRMQAVLTNSAMAGAETSQKMQAAITESTSVVTTASQKIEAELGKSALAGIEKQREAINQTIAETNAGIQKVQATVGQAASAGVNNQKAAVNRAILDLSRGVQDFASAGLMGVVNNVEGIARNVSVALGKSADQAGAVAGKLTLVAVAAQVGLPLVAKLVDSIAAGLGLASTNADKAASSVKGMSGGGVGFSARGEAAKANAEFLFNRDDTPTMWNYLSRKTGTMADGAEAMARNLDRAVRATAAMSESYEMGAKASRDAKWLQAGSTAGMDLTTARKDQSNINRQLFQEAIDKFGGGENLRTRIEVAARNAGMTKTQAREIYGGFKEGDFGATRQVESMIDLTAEKVKIMAEDFERATGAAEELRNIDEKNAREAKADLERQIEDIFEGISEAADLHTKRIKDQNRAAADEIASMTRDEMERQGLQKQAVSVQGRIDDLMSQRAKSEIIGASALFERNLNAGTGEDPQVKAIEKLGEELKEILNEIKGLG